jgi:hypothetical protein
VYHLSEHDLSLLKHNLVVMERAAMTGRLVRLIERAEDEGYQPPETLVPASRANPEKDKLAQVGQVSKRGIVEGRGNKGGVSEIARKLGRPRETVRRELKVDALSNDAKEAAKELGLADHPHRPRHHPSP